MADGIIVKVLGDHGPFSRIGKSIGYQITIGSSNYLIDCGAPLFQYIGGHGLQSIDGLIVTHCHDDHKRWYSDLALFNIYAVGIVHKVTLFTSENVNEELKNASASAIDRSLSVDSKSIVDVSYDDHVNFNMIGPRSRYKIVSIHEDKGRIGQHITDEYGNIVGPDMAKIVINPNTKRKRMLFKDPEYKEWVEPESFYPFSSTMFYEKEQNIYSDKEGFTIQAIKSPVWHGIPAIGIKITTDKETLIFSSDTVHDKELWNQLYSEKRTQNLDMSKKEFEFTSVIYGNINNYIERVWSKERYLAATKVFNNAVVVHDVAGRKSVVHTDYEKLKTSFLCKNKTILTHSPDKITSEWVLCNSGKTFKIREDKFYEMVDGKLVAMDADIYHREEGRYFVGYKNENGKYIVYEEDGLLGIAVDVIPNKAKTLYRIDLYEDISGKYFPATPDGNTILYERRDGKVERIEFTEYGSTGEMLEDCRSKRVKKNEECGRKSPDNCCPRKDIAANMKQKRLTSSDLEFFMNTSLFTSIPSETVTPLLNSLKFKHIKAGERFITQGDEGDSLYIIQNGSCIINIERDNTLNSVARLKAGDIVGEMAVLTGEGRSTHVDAETDMDVWRLAREQFYALAQDFPDLRNFLTEIVVQRFSSLKITAQRTIGKYIINEILDQGAWSIVYKGVHSILNFPVAIKMLKHNMAMDDDFSAKFQDEAKTIARLNHPNIVKVFDIEELYRTVFIVMEFLEGFSLKYQLRNMPRPSLSRILDIILQVCSGLEYAHKQGIIHQDIKPANIFIQPDGLIKIVDFGLACPRGNIDFNMPGTPFYMSPEQIQGEPVDERTDIYSLGIMIYEMLTGKRPFPEDNLGKLLELHVKEDTPDPRILLPDLPEELHGVIMKSIRKDPAERFNDISEVIGKLRPLMEKMGLKYQSQVGKKEKMMGLFLFYRDEHQLDLNRLIDKLNNDVGEIGVLLRVVNVEDI